MRMKRIEKLMSKQSRKCDKIPDLMAEDEKSMTLSQCFTFQNVDSNGDSLTTVRSGVRRKLFNDEEMNELFSKLKRTPGKRSLRRTKKLLSVQNVD